MDLLQFFGAHIVNFWVASVPLLLTFFQLKVFKLPVKPTFTCVALCLIVSCFFWIKLNDFHLFMYQAFPYVASFLWIWAEHKLAKASRSGKENKENRTGDGLREPG